MRWERELHGGLPGNMRGGALEKGVEWLSHRRKYFGNWTTCGLSHRRELVLASSPSLLYHEGMIATTIREKLRQEPFEPFAIRSSSGTKYLVRSPDLVVLMKSSVFVAMPNSDSAATVSYLHITAVESVNGHEKRSGRARRTK